jgi:hypothetical protein
MIMPSGVNAQSGDQGLILKKVISLPELQKHYPVSTGKTKQVVIVQTPVSFPSNLDISDAGMNVSFIQLSELKKESVGGYFMFRTMETNATSSSLKGHYFYNYDPVSKKSEILEVNAQLEKSGSDWKIVNANVKGVK